MAQAEVAEAGGGAARTRAVGPLDRAQAAILETLRAGDAETALAEVERLARRYPFEAGPFYLRGVILARRGDNEAACAAFLQSLRLRPDHADSAIRAGRAMVALDRHLGAIDLFSRAIGIAPASHRAHRGLAFAFQGAQRHEDAVASFGRALALVPDDVPSLIGLTTAHVSLRQGDEAVVCARRATERDPAKVEAWLVLGDAWQLAGDLVSSEAAFRKGIEVAPLHAEAHNALGRMLGNIGKYDEAMACFERALEIKPGFVEATWNISLNALRLGDYARGWETYEVRWQRKEAAGHPTFSKPLWLGDEPLAGKTLLLHGEQGIGDTVQFLRYVPHACALGGRVLLGLQQRAEALHECFRSDAQIVFNRRRIPRFDFHAPLGSLPHALRRSLSVIPADVPYLFASPERLARWNARIEGACGPAGRRPRVGIAWSGDPSHPNDHNRSIAFRDMHALFDGIDADLVVLQRPVRASDEADVAVSGVHNLAIHSDDMHDAVALVSQMDLVVAVDTSLAHVAGALAKDVFVLLPFSPDWRWLVERPDSPWYPTMRLVRQPAFRAWQPAFEELKSLLRARLG